MNAGKEKTYVQCQNCGHIYYIEQTVPIDKLYIASVCPECEEDVKVLNCGNKEEDLYFYYDPVLDERYYK